MRFFFVIRCCEIFNLYLKIYYSTAEWSDDDNDFDYDFMNADELYSHAEIIDQSNFRQVEWFERAAKTSNGDIQMIKCVYERIHR